MLSKIKQHSRRRLLGRRFHQQLLDDHRAISRLGNLHYLNHHPEILAPGFGPTINAYEFSVFSQNGEDGILLHLLSRIGIENRLMVEIGTQDGRECNSANLLLNFGWKVYLIEAEEKWTKAAREYFSDCQVLDRVEIQTARVTSENINDLLKVFNCPQHIDILSIDIDSHDYWLWQAVEEIVPRIVVIEYNASFGPSRSITIPCEDYPELSVGQARVYHGASITALQRLGERKGYSLVAGDSRGINAFFVRTDLAEKAGLASVTPEQAYRPHFWRTQKRTQIEQFALMATLPFTEIT